MTESNWRPLGELLIERDLIDGYELEYWLKQQKLTGTLLGELLVVNRVISAVDVAAALAIQRGADAVAAKIHDSPRQLGRILVENDVLTDSGLQRALLAQRRKGGSLGAILVERGYVTPEQLGEALAEQRGLGRTRPELQPPKADLAQPKPEEAYEVRSPETPDLPIYASDSFLEATDFAFDLIEAEDPEELEIIRVAAGSRESVWSYSRAASEAFRKLTAASQRAPAFPTNASAQPRST